MQLSDWRELLHKLAQNCKDPEKGLKKLDNNWEISKNKRIPDFFFFGKISDSLV